MSRMIEPDILNLPINKEICFSNHKGEFSKKIMEDQAKILIKFVSLLKPLLEPGEEILLAVQATSPTSFFEQWTTGWVLYYLKRCVLIFTNRRILHFPTNHHFTPKHSISQIRYGDIEEFKLSGFLGRALKIRYRSGKKENFSNIKPREFKKLKTLEHLFIKSQPSPVGERHFLCPKCISPLLKNEYTCPNCHLEFKSMKDAIRLSIFIPGGGYFYTRHYVLGVLDAITEGVLLLELIARLYYALSVLESWGSVLLVAILLFYEKLITIYHTRHYVNEYIPIDKNIGVVSFTPAPESFSADPLSPKPRQKKWVKTVFAIILFIFSMSILAWKLYPYWAYRNQNTTQNTLREVPVDPQKERAMAALLKTKYTRMDDNEKWSFMLYQNKDFDTVEKKISDLLGQHQDEAKTYELYHLYNILGDVSEDKDIDLKKNVLDEWCSKHPESHIPWLVRGSFYIEYAWYIRGSGWAKDVKEDAWPKFHAMLEQAQADLEKSYQLNLKDPNSSCFLLIVARGLSYPREKMEENFSHATSACPWHFGSHYMKLQYLKPKWCGSWEEMHNFATDCLRFTERYPYLGLVMVEALEEIHFFGTENKNYLGEDEVWSTIENVYDIFFAKYPEDIRRRFFYAYHAYNAKKYDVAIKQFEIIGDRWIGNTSWKSLKLYNNCRAFAYSAHAVTLPPKQAVDHLKKSIEVDPTEKNSHFNLGGFSMMMGQYDEAERAFLKVIELDPYEGKAYLQLSCIYWRNKNDFIKAKEYAEKALRCDLTGEEKRQAKICIKSCNQRLKKQPIPARQSIS